MTPSELQHGLNEARQSLLAHEFARALPRYEKLTRQCPGEAVVWAEYGNAACGLGQVDLADRAWQKALGLAAGNSDLIGMIGHQYQGMRKPEKASACFAQAAAADPRGINPRISLAVLLEKSHRLEEARAAVKECLAIDSKDEQARYFLAVLERRENKLESAETQLRDLIKSEPRHPFVQYACRYELAQILDRKDDSDGAMRLLGEAKQIVRGLTDTDVLLKGYDQGAESARRFTRSLPKTILRTWAEYFPERKRESPARLAFLGGHPRSGTTLLEQVLDSHPEVAALDEPTAFLDILQPEFHKSKELSSARLNTLRRLYTQALVRELGPAAAGKLLLDKNPSPTATANLAAGVPRIARNHRIA
jgi:Flp pilus assembly protein TadD